MNVLTNVEFVILFLTIIDFVNNFQEVGKRLKTTAKTLQDFKLFLVQLIHHNQNNLSLWDASKLTRCDKDSQKHLGCDSSYWSPKDANF